MRVYISAPRQKRFFIECVKGVVEEKRGTWFYPPDKFRDLDDKQILKKVMREMRKAHVVLMDVSMKNVDDEWYPNSGVMIEFGLLMRDPTKGLGSAYIFCDETTDRDHLPPMIPRVQVDQYSENEEDFKETVRCALEAFGRKVLDREQQARERAGALERLYELSKERYSPPENTFY